MLMSNQVVTATIMISRIRNGSVCLFAQDCFVAAAVRECNFRTRNTTVERAFPSFIPRIMTTNMLVANDISPFFQRYGTGLIRGKHIASVATKKSKSLSVSSRSGETSRMRATLSLQRELGFLLYRIQQLICEFHQLGSCRARHWQEGSDL